MMMSLVQDHEGAPLRRAELPMPEPGPGQVLVRVHAIGLNPVDADLVAGGNPEWSWPHTPILDAAGVVELVGEGVTAWTPGDRVAAHGDLRRQGAAAQFALFDEEVLARIPEKLTFEQAAALPCAGMTAYQAVHRRLHVALGEGVLITGATGGVGGYAVQLAREAGARVVALASRDQDAVLQLGAHEVIDYRAPDAAERILQANGGRPLDAVVDVVGPASVAANVSLLTHAGGIACVAGLPNPADFETFGVSPSLHEISLGAAYSHGELRHRQDLSTMLGELMCLTASGRLTVPIAQVIGLDDVDAALTSLRERHTRGKIVALLDA
ncbi:zinc-binding dehydrogenase [Galactobacter valiniphilus]|uniref:zinc-binding dehydrogenase n=1 Tax=Galactobacter valiniphilus TaxID=2676122 RepID=UPI003734FD03